jgi:HSP20 family protein
MSTTTLQHENSTALAQPPAAEANTGVTVAPRIDIFETEAELLLVVDLPGVRPDEIDIRFENGELQLHGRRTSRFSDKRPVYWEQEPVSYQRVFRVNEKIESTAIHADLKHGVLTIHLPKTEGARPRRISVSGA